MEISLVVVEPRDQELVSGYWVSYWRLHPVRVLLASRYRGIESAREYLRFRYLGLEPMSWFSDLAMSSTIGLQGLACAISVPDPG